ncbi:berberine bridge enzyme-like 14 [Amaranthus tricolor]|uniref:berberine bridge enzyme-like 14 n=1 Tax=Amaranthus tricolor TaxID=29722 RepID=UPI002582F733|nr:berberine bridge enzyme-like 14 [Amaranthus tricolor]
MALNTTTFANSMLQFCMLIVCILHVNVASNVNFDIQTYLDCLPKHSSNAINLITNVIYTPKNASFLSILNANVKNLRFNTSKTPKPLAIITPLEASHVQASVICAKIQGLEMRIRSGGHDYDGLSYVSPNPFVILDLFNLHSISIDLASDTAWVQSGATLGVCPSVGTGGHFSGGGYGNMLRKFGLTVDNIIDAEIVDANGVIHNRTTMGEDLFWAIRGGGGASFCVILSWKIKLVQIHEIVTTFQVEKSLEQGGIEIFDQWQHIAPNLDPNLFIRVEVSLPKKTENENKTVIFKFISLFLGRSDALVEQVNQFLPLLNLTKDECTEQSWINSTLFFYGLPNNTSLEVLLERVPALGLTYEKHKSDYVKRPIPKPGLIALSKKLVEVENVTMQFNPYGGKMSEIPENATPFPHRKGVLCKIQYLCNWKENSNEVSRKNIMATQIIHSFMTPYVSKNPREAFLNYRDIDIGTNANKSLSFAQSYFKGNLIRLLMVKAKVDPNNVFSFVFVKLSILSYMDTIQNFLENVVI